ncbi:MAG: hypothetical protein M1837_007239 [Sclerophora amabilis]|nr:MAG: hypothetical protein M1837_007239 [Sclerophora amabilis]
MTTTKKARKPAKLPVQQLAILSICRIAEPVALTSIFPYIPEMMEFLGVETAQVAYYAGLTAAIFSLCQCLTGVPWGIASDRFGRKPVILAGMTCTMLTSILFGFARSLPLAIAARAVAGLGNGNVGIIRTTVAEMVPQRELQPRAFSIMPLIWTIGSIFGPSFGGFFANPAQTWGWQSGFFKTFPYALPNLIASVLFLVGLSAGTLFLHETLETRKHRRDYGIELGKRLTRPFRRKLLKVKRKSPDPETASLLGSLSSSSLSSSTMMNGDLSQNDEGRQPQGPPASTARPGYREVFSRQSSINLLVYCLLALHSVAFDQLLPIFMHHPLQNHSDDPAVHLPFKFAGGFGMDSNGIGLIFTFYGIFGMLGQFLVFPPMARRLGILNCLKACAVAFPILYILTPFTVLFESSRVRQVTIFILMAVKSLAVIHAFPSSTILLTNSAASLRILGTLNGFATSVSAIGRAAGPAIGGITFTVGVSHGYVIAPWWTIAAFAAAGAVPVWWLVESKGFGGSDGSDSETEEDDEEDEQPHSTSGENNAPMDEIEEAIDEEEGEEEEEEGEEEGLLEVTSSNSQHGRDSSRQWRRRRRSSATASSLHRAMSSPIGMRGGVGPGEGRTLSTNLGPTNNGFGAGGTSWH